MNRNPRAIAIIMMLVFSGAMLSGHFSPRAYACGAPPECTYCLVSFSQPTRRALWSPGGTVYPQAPTRSDGRPGTPCSGQLTWTSSGGTGSINSYTGVYTFGGNEPHKETVTITATCMGAGGGGVTHDSDSYTLYVGYVNLTIADMSEATEENPGAFTAERPSRPRVPLKLEFSFEDPNYNPTSDNGTLTISSQCGSCATLWDASLGGAQISLPMSASGANLPRNLSYTAYVQGKPETYGNGLFTLSFWGGGCSGSDSCKITVSRLDIATSLSNNPFSPLSDPEYVPGTPNEDDPGIFIPKGGSRYMQILYRHGEDPVPAPLPGDVARFEALAPPAHVSLMWLNPPQPPPQPFALPWLPPMNSLPSNGVCQGTFEVTGESVGVDTIRWRMPVPNASPVEDTVKLTVVDLDNLEWEKYTVPNLPPGAQQNPALMQMYDGSVGMFPDQFPEDPVAVTERQKVWVKATITPAVPGVTVYFRIFDVDDPSTSLVIDPNAALGEDNMGLKSAWLASAVTDASGVARTVCSVSLYPGDNWRAVASCNYSALVAADAIQVEYGPTPAGCKVSKKLTVWRRAWVEADSMAAPLATGSYENTNYYEATVSTITPASPSVNTIIRLTSDPSGENNELNGGWVYFPHNGAKFLIQNHEKNHPTEGAFIQVAGVVPADYAGKAVRLYDDDWENPPSTLKVPLPYYSLPLNPRVIAIYADAYVMPCLVDMVYRDGDYPFAAYDDSLPTDRRDLTRTEGFWLFYFMLKCQRSASWDDDPDNPLTAKLGNSEVAAPKGQLALEVIRDACVQEFSLILPDTLAHEMGHQIGLNHDDTTPLNIMNAEPEKYFDKRFGDQDIKHIRTNSVIRSE